jgi:hypothetical protein
MNTGVAALTLALSACGSGEAPRPPRLSKCW